MDETRYGKAGVAGATGTGFQVAILTLMCLNALQRFDRWSLSTENDLAGKFDDAVLQWPGGGTFLQAKHKEKKKNKKTKISKEDLLSTSSKNEDFSVPKYLISFLEKESKFEGDKTLIICTNADIDKKALEFLSSRPISRESVLYYGKDDYLIYTLNKNYLGKFIELAKEYLKKNSRNRTVKEEEITEENVEDFMDRLQIFTNFPSDKELENVIEQLWNAWKLHSDLYKNIFARDLCSKVNDWFKQLKGIYLTNIRAKAMFSELRTEKYGETLTAYGVRFRRENLPDSKRIYHIVAENGYLLQVIKMHDMLRNAKTKFLSINPDDNVEAQKEVIEAFRLREYTHLIIVWPKSTEESVMIEIIDQLSATLKAFDYKKIILVTESGEERLFGLGETDPVKLKPAMFNDLTDESQEKLLNKTNIVFQGRSINLKEMLRGRGDLEKGANLSLEKLVGDEKVTVGAPLQDMKQRLTHLYINRTFKQHKENTNEEEGGASYSEEEICDMPGKMILIADTAGTGKSTVLTKLATVIKEKSPWLWVIRIDLNDFSATLRDSLRNKRTTISILDLLQSKRITRLTNELDNFVFALEEKVVLMLDGVDEISPDYTDLVTNLLIQCQEATNVMKIFITTRPHMVEELRKKLQIVSFTLEPFTETNQENFLTDYWAKNLNLREDADKRKCEKYARALVNKMSQTDLINKVDDYFAAIPLQLWMLAEIFQTSMVVDKSVDWEGCAEYIKANEKEPRLPEKMNLVKLYHIFIDKKRDIFMNRENPTGHTAASQALSDQFDKCLFFHQDIALKIILSEDERQLFPHYDVNENVEEIALKIGIIQKFDNKLNFVHRTLAEYFVAQRIIRELQDRNQNPEFQKFLIDTVFSRYEFNIVVAFVDNFMQDNLDSIPPTIFRSYQSLNIKESIYYDIIPYIIYNLAETGCVAVLRLILRCTNFTIIESEERYFEKSNIAINIEKYNTLTCLEYVFKQVGLNFMDILGRTPLFFAASMGHLKMVKFLIQHGSNVDSKSKEWYPVTEAILRGHNGVAKYLLEQIFGLETTGVDETLKVDDSAMEAFLFEIIQKNNELRIDNTTVACVAVCKGWLNVVQACLESGININDDVGGNVWGNTLFHLIKCKRIAVSTVEELIRLGVDIDITDDRGRTALHCAYDNPDMMDLLLKSGANVGLRDNDGRTALHEAAYYFNFDCVKLLINCGAVVNARDNKGNTALHLWYMDKDKSWETTKFLIENGTDVNVKNNYGQTALHLATLYGDEESIKPLIQAGADIDAKDKEGRTPLHVAVTTRNSNIMDLLLKSGANVGLRSNNGCTALHEAAYYSKLDCVKLLINCGADVNARDNKGNTVLHLCCMGNDGSWEIAKFLIENGVDVNVKNDYGRTVLHVAAFYSDEESIKPLIQACADIDAKDKEGRTPLHLAATKSYEFSLKSLIEKGADVESRDNEGRTPYDLALEKGHLHLLQYFKKEDPQS